LLVVEVRVLELVLFDLGGTSPARTILVSSTFVSSLLRAAGVEFAVGARCRYVNVSDPLPEAEAAVVSKISEARDI
jgi:hypothetical protein